MNKFVINTANYSTKPLSIIKSNGNKHVPMS